MDIADIIAADERREGGAWVRSGFRDLPGLALKVRGDGNVLQARRATELFGAASTEDRARPGFDVELRRTVALDTLLVDWNLSTPFSPEAAKPLLERPTFLDAVEYASRVVAATGAATLEADRGN